MKDSLVAGIYDKAVDRESAYEKLTGRVAGPAAPADATDPAGAPAQPAAAAADDGGILGTLKDMFIGTTGPRGGKKDGLVQTAAKSAVRTIGTQVGREILRGVLGSILGGGKRR
jgi:hypothetical protein